MSEIFKSNREDFENKWDDLSIFIKYGMLTEEKFYEKATKFCLFKNTDNKYFTFDEYKELIKNNQTDKDGNIVYLYTTNTDEQYSFIEAAKAKGYDVLLMDGQLDTHFVNHLETKFEKSKFTRVDADIVEKLIVKEEDLKSTFTNEEEEELSTVFKSVTPNNATFDVRFEGLKETDNPVTITQNEFMRRMKDMSKLGGGGMNLYGDLPDSYTIVVNTNHPLVKATLKAEKEELATDFEKLNTELKKLEETKKTIENETKDIKPEEIPQEKKDKLEETDKKISEIKQEKEQKLNNFGKNNKLVSQLIDLALISNNMLKGERLNKFVKRSVELIEA